MHTNDVWLTVAPEANADPSPGAQLRPTCSCTRQVVVEHGKQSFEWSSKRSTAQKQNANTEAQAKPFRDRRRTEEDARIAKVEQSSSAWMLAA